MEFPLKWCWAETPPPQHGPSTERKASERPEEREGERKNQSIALASGDDVSQRESSRNL